MSAASRAASFDPGTHAYLEALFEDVSGFIDMRTIDANETTIRRIASTIDEAANHIEKALDVNVYTGIATRRTGGTAKGEGGKGNLHSACALWVDIDFHAPEDERIVTEVLSTFPYPPSMRVSSGGGVHLYWLLNEPYDLTEESCVETFENVLKGLCHHLGGDFAVTDASRIMRVPGTTNYPNKAKRDRGRTVAPCTLQHLDENCRYAFDDFDAFELCGSRLGGERNDPKEYESGDFDGTLPASVQAALDAKGPNGNPRYPKLLRRWGGDLEGLGGNQSASELDQSIAILLALIGVRALDIENSLRFRRQEAGDKTKHTGYFRLTVGKALARAEKESAKREYPESDDGEPNSEQADDNQDSPKQIDRLLRLLDQVDLFHTPSGDAYVDLSIESRRETRKIKSRKFAQWLRREFRARSGGSADPKMISQAIDEATALAFDEGDERDVHVRNARGKDGAIYIDLGDDSWKAIKIDGNGWSLLDSLDVPVRFRRPVSLKPLPLPQRGGSINELRNLLNVESDAGFYLVVGFMIGAMNPDGPFAHLGFRGEQGTGKTTAAAIVQYMVDPTAMGPSALPGNQRDAVISAASGHLLNYDNVSSLSPWQSDLFCRLSTGASSAYRALYTDDGLALFSGRNPLLLNGITSIVDKPDLGERCIFVTLKPIERSHRKLEREVWKAAEAARPGIFGALLDAMVYGFQHIDETHIDDLPRMADFALWVSACEGRFWQPGSFLDAYNANQSAAVDEGIANDIVGSAIRDLMRDSTVSWTGTCLNLLDDLNGLLGYGKDKKAPKDWPQTPQKLSPAIDRASASLRTVGISITRRRRSITIENLPRIPPGSRNLVNHVHHVHSEEESTTCGTTRSHEGDEMGNAYVTTTSLDYVNGNNELRVPDVLDEVAGVLQAEDTGWGDVLDEEAF